MLCLFSKKPISSDEYQSTTQLVLVKSYANKRYHEVTEIGNFYMASVMDVHADLFSGINLGKANAEQTFKLLPTCHHMDKP